tara:strand:+ start:1087 stop:1461 length:375 start_codon:yes stop_codon:yes gene_type:complete
MDELSPFKYYYNESKGKANRPRRIKPSWCKEFDISPKYLKKIWEKQGGICPYTGYEMVLTSSTKRLNGLNGSKDLKVASLDRINPNRGYIRGNVEFVCIPVNLAKNVYSRTRVKNFFDGIQKKG